MTATIRRAQIWAEQDGCSPRTSCAWRAEPNAAHHALADVERAGVAVRILTQNVDGLCIVVVALGLNLLGDGLRDALDPRETPR
jgi:hypothetical protein